MAPVWCSVDFLNHRDLQGLVPDLSLALVIWSLKPCSFLGSGVLWPQAGPPLEVLNPKELQDMENLKENYSPHPDKNPKD